MFTSLSERNNEKGMAQRHRAKERKRTEGRGIRKNEMEGETMRERNVKMSDNQGEIVDPKMFSWYNWMWIYIC